MKDKNKLNTRSKNLQFDIHPLSFLLHPFRKESS